jgi:hypothetical protein
MPGNMSTSIDELPGPLPDMQHYFEEEEEEQYELNVDNHGIERMSNNPQQDIKMEIKKKSKQPSFFQIINKELNEENILIFAILFTACLPQVTEYTVHLIMITPLKEILKSNISVSLFKCLLLLILFLIVKNYFLN